MKPKIILCIALLFSTACSIEKGGTTRSVLSPSATTPTPAPTPTPTPTPSNGTLSDDRLPDGTPLALVRVYDSPADILSWPIGTKLTRLEIRACECEAFNPDFDKEFGPGRWPDVVGSEGGLLQFTLGIVMKGSDGAWAASAPIRFWNETGGGDYGRFLGGPAYLMASNWFYDQRWGTLYRRLPRVGETVGMFVVSGEARGPNGNKSVRERSQVVVFQWAGANPLVITR